MRTGNLGAYDLIMTPFTMPELHRVLCAALRHHTRTQSWREACTDNAGAKEILCLAASMNR